MDLKRKLARLSAAAGRVREEVALEPAAGGGTGAATDGGTAPILGSVARGELASSREGVPGLGEASERVERLRRLAALRTQIDELMAREALRPRRHAEHPETRVLPAEARPTAAGPLYACERRYGLDHHHGTTALRSFLAAGPADIAKLALDPGLAEVDPARLLFFDLETTGLAGGTGTLPFIIGLAFLEGEGLCVEQLFLRRPGEELPMLERVRERVAAASAIVSFNGKSFDWPLLRTRFVLNRLTPPDPPRHLDLLHCARRVFRLRVPQMRLGDLERAVLGFEREDDVDGSEIPASYFAYLRDGDGGGLEPVFTHNAHDLLAVAAILGRLAAMFAAVGEDDPRDHLGLARVAARAGDAERALRFAAAVAEHPSGRLAVSGLRLAADLCRRRGDCHKAAELLERALDEAPREGEETAEIRLSLAKLYEHQLKDVIRAIEHARHTVPAEDGGAQTRRLARLARRLGLAPEG